MLLLSARCFSQRTGCHDSNAVFTVNAYTGETLVLTGGKVMRLRLLQSCKGYACGWVHLSGLSSHLVLYSRPSSGHLLLSQYIVFIPDCLRVIVQCCVVPQTKATCTALWQTS